MKFPCFSLFSTLLIGIIGDCAAGEFAAYHEMNLEGWKIHVEQVMVDKNDPRIFLALRALRKRLKEVKREIPSQHIEQLQGVPLWISKNNGNHAEYYFFERRVHRNGINPKMLGGIEFKNINILLAMQHTIPSLIIHELAHAYHKINYEKIDQQIMHAYINSENKQLYKEVSTIRNHEGHAEYASKSPFEYFADLTSMYYGSNPYYPHDRDELREHDPVGFKMIEDTWK